MAKKIIIEKSAQLDPFKCCDELENGNILFFPEIPFEFPIDEIAFLLSQRQGSSSRRKNIAYKPSQDKITNCGVKDPKDQEKLKEVLSAYSRRAAAFLSELLEPYSKKWKLDYASYRPFEEKKRGELRIRARNDLLHVDAFPTRPLHGSRILRFFTNINPKENRHWITSEDFENLLKKYGEEIKVPDSTGSNLKSRIEKKLRKFFKLPLRSPYDHFMLQMHHFMKENQEFQKNSRKDHWEFPPNSCWAVFTDTVSHAALSGQYALEQTFLVPQNALLCPEKSPASVLQRVSGKNLIDLECLEKLFPTL